LKKAYLFMDSRHGPKKQDIDMMEDLNKTGLAHQLVLTKLDLAPATVWNQLGVALGQNPVRSSKSIDRQRLPKSFNELEMGVWAPLRGKLGLGCDETILGISSKEGWGLSNLRCSILKACGAFKGNNFDDDRYLKALEATPVINDNPNAITEEGLEEGLENEDEQWGNERESNIPRSPNFDDNNPMRGEVFGGEKMSRQKIYRW
jgi:hypothetical protein